MFDGDRAIVQLQRSIGRAEVEFAVDGLKTLYQSGCAKILLPNSYCDVPEAVIINTGGGLTGGDRFHIHASVKEGANLCLSSQTAERIYRSGGGLAEVVNNVSVGAGCSFQWLPQETILFDGAALKRKFEAGLQLNSSLLALEMLVLGRTEMGETLKKVTINDQWRVWRDGKIIYGDGLRFGPKTVDNFSSSAVFGGNKALAVLLYVAPDAQNRLEEAKAILANVNIEAAASAWNSMLVVRFISNEAMELRQALINYLHEFRGRELPKVWHM